MDYVKRNLQMMRGTMPGQMQELLNQESWGGTAGYTIDGRRCAGARFYADRNTGQIIYFVNYEVPQFVPDFYTSGMFRVAADKEFRQEIIKTSFDKDISEAAKETIRKSAELYNSMQ